METINNLELTNENIYPDEKILKGVLGEAYSSYQKLLALYAKHGLTTEWRYYKDGKAWLCKVQKKKKTIVWMSAWKGFMQTAIYFPVRLIDRVYDLDIRNEIKENIKSTKNVGKSKPCIFKITNDNTLVDFEKVMISKIDLK